ncbi:hypothetical protein SAY87_004719 [Trapa incisa]|uniref:Uncharacterized protein n=1 Tax=Trapa incisa TaxID=236973 RepID=A0AAN7JQ50_9MYRT|nr:hypothetical protein SAY87_004719 [Trapa incisa]
MSGFADEMKNAKRVEAFEQYMVRRSSEATFSVAFEKQEAIIRYLGGFYPTGEMQKVMGATLDLARSNLAKNSPCPCGSKKLYKRSGYQRLPMQLESNLKNWHLQNDVFVWNKIAPGVFINFADEGIQGVKCFWWDLKWNSSFVLGNILEIQIGHLQEQCILRFIVMFMGVK